MTAQAINLVRPEALARQTVRLYQSDELVMNLAPMFQAAFNLISGDQWNITFYLSAYDRSGGIYQVTSNLPLRDGEWGNDFRNGIIFGVIPSQYMDGQHPGNHMVFLNAEVSGISRTYRLPVNVLIGGGIVN